MKKGFYVNIIDVAQHRIVTVYADTEAEAVEICRENPRAEAHEWANFPDGLGNYDLVFFEKWADTESAYN